MMASSFPSPTNSLSPRWNPDPCSRCSFISASMYYNIMLILVLYHCFVSLIGTSSGHYPSWTLSWEELEIKRHASYTCWVVWSLASLVLAHVSALWRLDTDLTHSVEMCYECQVDHTPGVTAVNWLWIGINGHGKWCAPFWTCTDHIKIVSYNESSTWMRRKHLFTKWESTIKCL